MYKAGFSKVLIDYPLLEIGMMGYGTWNNRVKGKETELYCRAVTIVSGTKKLIFVNAEIASISPVIRRKVMGKLNTDCSNLQIQDSEVMLTAQHTHSAPSGYSEYSYYNFTTPGFRTEILDAYVDAIVESIELSINNLSEAKLSYKYGAFEKNAKVAWNRSVRAYNKNPENEEVHYNDTQLAVDRNMYLLQIENVKGTLLGTINWFGVHTTCIGNDNTKVSFDNKGYAAQFLEEEYPNSIHVFAQGKAGDVSPHFHGVNQDKVRKKVKRKGDHLYAKEIGEKQFVKAKEIIESDKSFEVIGDLKSALSFSDYTNIKIDTDFSDGVENAATSDACIGLAFFKGTKVDGKGVPGVLAGVLDVLNKKLNKKRNDFKASQGNKKVIVNASKREILGQGKLDVLPSFLDFSVKEMNKQSRLGALKENTLVPVVLPIQLHILGNLAIVGVPGEITTTAGFRLEKTIKAILETYGIDEVILSPYANSYMGYITTKEEYDVQEYEGGHTIFGRWTLAAFQTKFKTLCNEIMKQQEEQNSDKGISPPVFSKKELDLRTY